MLYIMTISELKDHVTQTISNLKDHGIFPKENNLYDYKAELNFYGLTDHIEIFMRNFAKDILSFCNGNGGIIILGVREDNTKGILEDVGLNSNNFDLLNKLDLNLITQKFEKSTKERNEAVKKYLKLSRVKEIFEERLFITLELPIYY